MGTNIDRPTDRDRSDRGGDDETQCADADRPPRRDAEAARRSFAADERAAEADRNRSGSRDRGENDWNAVGLVTSLGATCLFGVGGVLARSVHLTTAASLAFVTAGLLFARRFRHRRV